MELKGKIVEILHKEVVPAMGCTEPVAVALACAKSKELLVFNTVEYVEIWVSANVYKNGLSVGVPYTGESGLPIAGALGIVAGKSNKDLSVLEGICEEELELAKKLLASKKLSIRIKDTDEKIYVEVNFVTDGGSAKTIIQGKHNQFTYLERNGEILLDLQDIDQEKKEDVETIYNLKIREIIEVIENIPFEKIRFMLDGLKMNEKIAKVGLDHHKGMGVGVAIYESIKQGILADDLMNNAMMLTAAGSDARMSGETMLVMSSNGSGNNGLTAILPIVAYKNKFYVEEERLAKALAISHMINSYIKYYIGRLSALCGCGVAAATGASVALTWLMQGNKDQIDGAIKNMAANISGMICDGAKVGCALKLSTAASTAVQSALLAINNKIVPSKNGIVAETAEETIKNLGTLSVEGMAITDHVILQVMGNMQSVS
ncbi:L-serine ammonia-lyase, iron-sulfur-dependent, subunit alpha [Clostridiaceae bacterium 35-E11]